RSATDSSRCALPFVSFSRNGPSVVDRSRSNARSAAFLWPRLYRPAHDYLFGLSPKLRGTWQPGGPTSSPQQAQSLFLAHRRKPKEEPANITSYASKPSRLDLAQY